MRLRILGHVMKLELAWTWIVRRSLRHYSTSYMNIKSFRCQEMIFLDFISYFISIRHCRDFFTSPFKAELLDSVVQPTNSGTFIDSFAGFDQKSSSLRSRCQLVLFTYRCQLLIILASPVQVDSASLAVVVIVLI